MLTGRPPFRGDGTLALLTALATQTPPPIRERVPEVPAEFDALRGPASGEKPPRPPINCHGSRPSTGGNRKQVSLTTSDGGSCFWRSPTSIQPASSALRAAVAPSRLQPRTLAISAIAAAAICIALAVVISLKTPYGEVVVDLAEGVTPEDVKIEVAGNGELKLADADHGWTIGVKEGRYNVELAEVLTASIWTRTQSRSAGRRKATSQ